MSRLIISSLIFLCGCAWWQAGVNDPTIREAAIEAASTYRSLGDATGVPYAGMAVGSLALVFVILLGGRKKVKENG